MRRTIRAGSPHINIYYVGINLGAILAPLICGTLGELYGWHWGFGAAGVGMCLGLMIYIGGSRYLPDSVRAVQARDVAAQAHSTFFQASVSGCCSA